MGKENGLANNNKNGSVSYLAEERLAQLLSKNCKLISLQLIM